MDGWNTGTYGIHTHPKIICYFLLIPASFYILRMGSSTIWNNIYPVMFLFFFIFSPGLPVPLFPLGGGFPSREDPRQARLSRAAHVDDDTSRVGQRRVRQSVDTLLDAPTPQPSPLPGPLATWLCLFFFSPPSPQTRKLPQLAHDTYDTSLF